jgi:hypothetical protein
MGTILMLGPLVLIRRLLIREEKKSWDEDFTCGVLDNYQESFASTAAFSDLAFN